QNALFAVVPSRLWEAFGLVVLESYAAGLPVIGSRAPGLQDLVQPGVTGELVAMESAAELADAMRRLFENPARARAMGDHARRFVKQFDWRVVAQRHLELYQELVAARARGRAA